MDISLQNLILNVAHSFVPVELVFLVKKQWHHRFIKVKGGLFQWLYKNYSLSSQEIYFCIFVFEQWRDFFLYSSYHIILKSSSIFLSAYHWKWLHSKGSKFYYYQSKKKKRFYGPYISKTSKSIRPLVVLEWITLVCCYWSACTVPEELQHIISLLMHYWQGW